MTERPPEFDGHADSYDEALRACLPKSQAEDPYFTEYKIEVLARRCGRAPRRILDFGCGIGKSLRLLEARFPTAEVWGFDVSAVSLEHAARAVPRARLVADASLLPLDHFDLILAANVFHHIPVEDRDREMSRCASMLEPNTGKFFLFEHNPRNPATRWVFERCVFDAGASMLTMAETLGHARCAGLRIDARNYTLFFPRQLAFLRGLEALLGWLPLGAQYCLEMSRAAGTGAPALE